MIGILVGIGLIGSLQTIYHLLS